jgi:hypothetical protein
VRLESTGFLERDPLRDGGFFKNRQRNVLAGKPELRSSPERIRTAVAGSKGQHAWPLHHGATRGSRAFVPKGIFPRSPRILGPFSCLLTCAAPRSWRP